MHFAPETLFETHELPCPLARTFYRRGLIVGTRTVDASCAKIGEPCVFGMGDVEVGAAAVGQNVMDELTQRQRTVLTILDEADGPLALREISSSLGPETKERQLREDLAKLKGKRLVMPTGHGRGARWRRA